VNAIRLPVKIEKQPNDSVAWKINDSNGICIARDLYELEAKQIVLALNMRDELLSEIQYVLNDSVKYPQLRLNYQTEERLMRVLKKATT